MGIEFLYGVVLTILFIIVIVVWIVSMYYIKKTFKPVPSRVGIYFDEHFGDIVSEWDLMKRKDIKTWKADILKRLAQVGKGISKVKAFRKNFDPRLNKLERAVSKLETR